MSTSLVFDTIDALVTTLRATSGLRDPATVSSAVPVYDGPPSAGTGTTTSVIVGGTQFAPDGDDIDQFAATTTIVNAAVPRTNTTSRREQAEVRCLIVGSAASGEVAPVRTSVESAFAIVQGALNASVNPLGLSGTILGTEVVLATLDQQIVGSTPKVVLNFVVRLTSRI